MNIRRFVALLFILIAAPAFSNAAVVINEIFYRAPDDLDDLQWIELHNTAPTPVDLAGYSFTKGLTFKLPTNTTIPADGYLVIARNPDRFTQYYPGITPLGPFTTPLNDKGEQIQLSDAAGNPVDSVKYNDKGGYSASADGQTASLERICPTASGELPANWAPSPLGATLLKPSGTPGQRNAAHSRSLPPTISKVALTPKDPAPDQPLRVQATIADTSQITEVALLYRIITPNKPGPELAIPMTRDGSTNQYSAIIPPQPANRLVRYRIRAINSTNALRLHPHPNDLCPTFSTFVHDKYQPGKIHLGYVINVGHISTDPTTQPTTRPVRRGSVWGALFGRPQPTGPQQGHSFGPPNDNLPPQGPAAFLYVDQKTATVSLFDHINITDRAGGYKIRFHKDKPLNGMTTVNLVLEQIERFVLSEPLSYELYRRAGVPCPRTDFVRLHVDDKPFGYHLLVEQPNSAFLRRNKIATGGNMYKLIWWGRGIEGQHEKKTNRHTGHDDLVTLINKLQQTQGDEQWKLIQDHFNVNQFVNYYAVNMVTSDWDGFFNNFFTYHDTNGSKKWLIFPWDRDKTWGYYDGMGNEQILTEMPLTFGMAGDRAPGRAGGFGGGPWGGPAWWRPGGYFSAPLLANPQFRKLFLARTKEICEKTYTTEVFFPIIDDMENRLQDEARLRATAIGRNPDQAAQLLRQNMQSLKSHLTKRREFLLNQPELQAIKNQQ